MSQRVVYKYSLASLLLGMPRGAELLHVGTQNGQAYAWALVDPAAPIVARLVLLYPTGGAIPDDAEYVGTFELGGREGFPLVCHVFDFGESETRKAAV